jgi:hypothetical protein
MIEILWDPDLDDLVRRCYGCAEFWPDSSEFFARDDYGTCLACDYERRTAPSPERARRLAQMREASRRHRRKGMDTRRAVG